MPLNDRQAAFVEAYLGIRVGAAGDGAAAGEGAGDKPLELWRDAKEEADQSIARLQAALKSRGDPALERIAEFGLNGVSDGNQVALSKRLFEYDMSPAEGRGSAAKGLKDEIGKYRDMLASSTVIDLCEKNPFKVDVTIRKPLNDALDRIERMLGS